MDQQELEGAEDIVTLVDEDGKNHDFQVVDIIEQHNIVVLQGVAAHIDPARQERRMLHAVGDGTFIIDGRKVDRRAMMAAKLPPGV